MSKAIELAEKLVRDWGLSLNNRYEAAAELRRLDARVEGTAQKLNDYHTIVHRFHKLMEKHGLHPGRTDDDLIEILDADIEASKVGLHHLREKNVEARAERDALRAENAELRTTVATLTTSIQYEEGENQKDFDKLRTELAAVRKDAERMRHFINDMCVETFDTWTTGYRMQQVAMNIKAAMEKTND